MAITEDENQEGANQDIPLKVRICVASQTYFQVYEGIIFFS